MIKKVTVFLLVVCSACIAISCAEGTHSTWKAKGVGFRKYKTYAWVAPGDTVLTTRRDDKLFAGRIEHYTNEELKKKGMSAVTRKPDAVFMFDTQVEDRMKYEQAPTLYMGVGYGGPGYYVGGMAPVAGGQVTAVPYRKGTLIIEMFGTQTRQLVWRGWSQKSMENSDDLNNVIKWAIRDMMYSLPVKAKS